MPLTNRVRERFSERLTQIRNLVVADVQLTNGADLSVAGSTAAKVPPANNENQGAAAAEAREERAVENEEVK